MNAQSSYNSGEKKSGGGAEGIGYIALILSWAVPGLGHFMLGERWRALVFALTIHLLFAAGLLVGGIRAINPPDQPIWSYTQVLAGWPMLVFNQIERKIDAQREKLEGALRDEKTIDNLDRPHPEDPAQQEARKAWAEKFFSKFPFFTYHPKVQDVGSVYCGIAGMLNLLVMFDVMLRITGSTREDIAAKKPAPAPADASGRTGGGA